MRAAPAIAAAGALFAFAPPALAADECKPADVAALSGWEGVWAVEGIDAAAQGLSGRSGQADYKLIGLGAPWNDAGWGRMAAMLRQASSGNVKQGGWGFPMMMDSFSEFTFAVAPSRTVVVNQYREVRTIYTDGRGHPPDDEIWATNWGDSTGCWQGDTLVVETVAVRFDPVFNIAAPPLSEQARFVERIRMVAPDRMENEMTITDPVYLEAPWTVKLTYIPAGIERLVLDAYDDRNDTEGGTIKASSRGEFEPVKLPANVALSEAQLDALVGSYQVEGAPVSFGFVKKGGRLFLRPPGFDGTIPLFAESPLDFVSLDGGDFHFVIDASGKAVSASGKAPDGTPTTISRKAP